MGARKAAQWDEERIRRFEEEQRDKREWIKFSEIAEWFSELGGSGPNEDARERAYKMLEQDLLEGRFEKGGHSRVRFVFPGVSWTHGKMTRKWLRDAIDNNLDGEHGRSYLRHCWLPQDLFKRWRARHHLPESPPRFQPEHAVTAVVPAQPVRASENSPRAIAKRRRPAEERIRQELEKKAPEFIDTPGDKTCWSIAQILVETRGSARKFDLEKTSKALKRYYANKLKD
jgi:hypothetical protein